MSAHLSFCLVIITFHKHFRKVDLRHEIAYFCFFRGMVKLPSLHKNTQTI